MQIRILYFAVLRERLGLAEEVLEIPGGGTVGAALAAIAARHPIIAPLLPRVQTAVNRTMVAANQLLGDNDEPIVGGRELFPNHLEPTSAGCDVFVGNENLNALQYAG